MTGGSFSTGFGTYRYQPARWQPPGGLRQLQGPTMGTHWRLKLPAACPLPLAEARRVVEGALAGVVRQMSTWEPDSDLSRYNRAPAGSWQALPPACFEVLRHALSLSADTGGAYDPTVGPLVDLWGFGPGPARRSAPPPAEWAAVRQRVGWQHVRLDAERRRAWQPGGVSIDLSSIAKGHAVDAVASALAERGVGDMLVDVGGELRGVGARPDGTPWRVAVKLPDRDGSAPGPVIALKDCAVATSGDDFHRYEDGGTAYSHTIDPRSGRPVAHALASVTVVHPSCMRADALATALAVLGPDDGWRTAERLGATALFIQRDGASHAARMTAPFAALLQ